MWYVIQVKSGEENNVKEILDRLAPEEAYRGCFIPLFEDVRRSGGSCRIGFRKLFPGYVFVDSDDPDRIFETIRGISRFTRMLGCEENDGRKFFEPIGSEDRAFIESLFSDGVMHLSYIHRLKNGRIDRIAGPLYAYRDCITKLEYRHRSAIVEAEMFGKKRRMKFSFWTDEDPKLPQIEKLKNGDFVAEMPNGITEFDIGIHPGDRIKDDTDVYEGKIFVVEGVDPGRRIVWSSVEILGSKAKIELSLDDVSRVE